MKFDYSNTAKTADRLLTRFGSAATLSRNSPGTYDPATGIAMPNSSGSTVTVAVIDYDQKFIDGTLIRQGDKEGYMSALGVSVPLAGDVLTWAGVYCSVIACKSLSPSGLDVLYTLQLRTIGSIEQMLWDDGTVVLWDDGSKVIFG